MQGEPRSVSSSVTVVRGGTPSSSRSPSPTPSVMSLNSRPSSPTSSDEGFRSVEMGSSLTSGGLNTSLLTPCDFPPQGTTLRSASPEELVEIEMFFCYMKSYASGSSDPNIALYWKKADTEKFSICENEQIKNVIHRSHAFEKDVFHKQNVIFCVNIPVGLL